VNQTKKEVVKAPEKPIKVQKEESGDEIEVVK
jgi:hypothetical protein